MSDTLLAALKTNNLQEAKNLLENGETLPAGLSDNEYLQLLDKLLRDSAFDLIRLLLKAKPVETDIYVYDAFSETFFEKLFFYIKNDEQAISFLDHFLTTVENINEDLMGLTLLGFAIEKAADPAVIKSLVKAGSDVNFVNNAEENLLHIIVKTNRMKPEIALAYLEYIIAEGVDVNAADIELKTPLHIAINGNRVEMIDLLLKNGADANAQNKTGESAFYQAVIHQQNYPVYLKLRETVLPDFEQQTKDGQRLLFEFVRRLDRPTPALLELLGKLIEDGADLLQTSIYYQKEKTALAAAAEQKFEVFNQIISLDIIDVNAIHEDGNTLLHIVCDFNINYDQAQAKDTYRKVKLLIDHGADVNITNNKDETPLMLASVDNLKAKTVELLLANQ